MHRAVALLLSFCILSLCTATASAERRVALVIGNGAYDTKHFTTLSNAINDARDVASALRSFNFDVTLKINASKREMESAIQALGTALVGGGVGLFYFAGHGMQFQGHNFLIPVQSDIRSSAALEYDAVNAERVLTEMSVAENGCNIVILDACRQNPKFPSAKRGAEAGFAEMRAPRGSLIAYATSPGSFAEDGVGRNGTYTENLLKHMRTRGQPVELMFKQVRTDVAKATGNQQIPWEHSSLIGDFSFIPGTGPVSVPAPPQPGRTKTSAESKVIAAQATLREKAYAESHAVSPVDAGDILTVVKPPDRDGWTYVTHDKSGKSGYLQRGVDYKEVRNGSF